MLKRIGVYGGTFDPVHLGHLAVVEAVREEARLDLVLFVPNNRQPLKAQGPFATGNQRLCMLQVALADNPGFAVDDLELRHKGPSYTIATLSALRQVLPEAALYFIMGADAAASLAAWRAPERILQEFHPLVMTRAGWPDPDWVALESISAQARFLVQMIQVPQIEIASSEIRRLVREGRSIRYLVPEGVRQIIEEKGLYASADDL